MLEERTRPYHQKLTTFFRGLSLSSLVFVGLFGLLLLFAILGYHWCVDDNFYVAVVGPMSGAQKAKGEAMARGVQICLDTFNDEGGIHGKQVKLLRVDNQNNLEIAQKKAEEIATQHVLFVVGDFPEGGEAYREQGVPLISGAAWTSRATEGHEWSFSIRASYRSRSALLAHYATKVLQHETVHLIVSGDLEKTAQAQLFEEIFSESSDALDKVWSFESTTDEAETEQHVRDMLTTLAALPEDEQPDILLLAVEPHVLEQIVVAIKRQSHEMALLTDYETVRQTDFSTYPEEQKRTGYFLDGLSVFDDFLFFDLVGSRTEDFQHAYEKRYFQLPGNLAALYYDTALAGMQAVKKAGVQGRRKQVVEERQNIHKALITLRDRRESLEGVTGRFSFDVDGSAQRSLHLGVFEDRTLIPALTQFQLADPQGIPSIKREKSAGRIVQVAGKTFYRTNIIYTGIDLHEINELDLESLTYVLDFDLWFRYRGRVDSENIEFLNATEPIQLGNIPEDDSAANPLNIQTGRLIAEQMSEGMTYRLYHIKGRFKADFLPSLPVFFREHVLGLSFRHRSLTSSHVMYMADVLFMNRTHTQSFWEKMRQTQVLSPASGWTIDGGEFFHNRFEKISLVNPQNLQRQQFTEDYSRFNAGIWIRKDEFTLRGIVSFVQNMIPAKILWPSVSLSGIVMLLLAFVRRIDQLKRVIPYLWVLRSFFAVVFLLSGERVLMNHLIRIGLEAYPLKLATLVFDVLWWLVGAFLVTLTVERFIWMPLQRRTARPVPRILRHSVTAIIYVLAFFGIVAFVFDRSVTSLVATSGMFALILAFSSKVDISNVFAGIGLSFSQPFRIDDWVKIGDCEEGQVVDMTSRNTKIQTRDYSMLSIPNTTVAASVIENFNYPDARFRLQFTLETVTIHHPERVQKVLLDAVLSTTGVLQEPEPQILFKGQGDSSAIYTVIFYIDDYSQKYVFKQDVWKRVWIHLERAGIGLATPRREILTVREAGQDVTQPLNVVQNVLLFEPLPDEAKTRLSEKMRKLRVPAGETIVKQGETNSKSLYMIAEGAVGLWVQSDKGDPIEVARLGTGDVVGAMGLLTGNARRFGVITLTETTLFEIVREDIAPFLKKNPELAERFSKTLTERQIAISARKDQHEAEQIDRETLASQILGKIQEFFGLKEEKTDSA